MKQIFILIPVWLLCALPSAAQFTGGGKDGFDARVYGSASVSNANFSVGGGSFDGYGTRTTQTIPDAAVNFPLTGGGHDGYGTQTMQTVPDTAVGFSLKGGSRDGYGISLFSTLTDILYNPSVPGGSHDGFGTALYPVNFIPPVTYINVLSPNGGESYAPGTTTTIVWNTTGATVSLVNVEFSSDGGSSWSTIASAIPNIGSYLLTTPVANTTRAFVRISSTTNATIRDLNDQGFTIHAQTAVNLRLFLEGPYSTSTGTMQTGLASAGYIPLVDPFGFGIVVASIPPGIVDWVRLDIRSSADNTLTLVSTAGFLRNDGMVVGVNGSNQVLFSSDVLPPASYYAVVRHRNHLGIMSASPIPLSVNSSTLYTFSTAQSQAYSSISPAMSQLGTTVYAMIAGDINQDGIINAIDRVGVRNATGTMGYWAMDVNLDGIVGAADRVIVMNNRFSLSQVP